MSDLTFRLATEDDLPGIIQMLADDTLGQSRETVTVDETYRAAFQAILTDSHQELTVAEHSGELVATFQLTFIQYLTYHGGRRAQIEAVRTHAAHRGRGIGKQVFAYAVERARANGCHMLQLTTDKRRPDALRFYESLGFVASHEGMQLPL